ncbi:hypothetical protein LTR08_000846 [Meristemomyces frigidus]|nr:hypothetical protein LTR08_000846 [Meristemomyces frigidus]
MDPNTNTRAEFTQGMLNNPMPDNASREWRSMVVNSKELFRLLAAHPGMQPNMRQAYMTPAAIKSKVYFMWDFVGRTLNFAYSVLPTLRNLNRGQSACWDDVLSRSALTATLILDLTPGMLDQLVEGTHPGRTGELPFGQRAVMGNDIKEAARKLMQR